MCDLGFLWTFHLPKVSLLGSGLVLVGCRWVPVVVVLFAVVVVVVLALFVGLVVVILVLVLSFV